MSGRKIINTAKCKQNIRFFHSKFGKLFFTKFLILFIYRIVNSYMCLCCYSRGGDRELTEFLGKMSGLSKIKTLPKLVMTISPYRYVNRFQVPQSLRTFLPKKKIMPRSLSILFCTQQFAISMYLCAVYFYFMPIVIASNKITCIINIRSADNCLLLSHIRIWYDNQKNEKDSIWIYQSYFFLEQLHFSVYFYWHSIRLEGGANNNWFNNNIFFSCVSLNVIIYKWLILDEPMWLSCRLPICLFFFLLSIC